MYPLVVTRYIKTGGVLVKADGVDANLYPSGFSTMRKLNLVVTQIPGEQHLAIPIGPEGKEITIEAPWNSAASPCVGKDYVHSLKNWNCNSIYGLAASGSLQDEIDSVPAYYLAKSISYSREAKTGRAGNFDRWALTMNLIKLRNTDVTDCPDFEDTTTSYVPATGTSPGLTLTSTLNAAETIEVKLTKITVKHTGAVQSFALYDEEALTVLPPLGNTGPVIDIEFRTTSATTYQIIKAWAATRSTMVAATQFMYPEIDCDNAPTYYSRWMVGNISITRSPASGAGVLAGKIGRVVSMSLTRYWKYELVEL